MWHYLTYLHVAYYLRLDCYYNHVKHFAYCVVIKCVFQTGLGCIVNTIDVREDLGCQNKNSTLFIKYSSCHSIFK